MMIKTKKQYDEKVVVLTDIYKFNYEMELKNKLGENGIVVNSTYRNVLEMFTSEEYVLQVEKEVKESLGNVYEIIEIEGTEFYTIEPEYFENEVVAEGDGYYWNDEISKWTKEIIDNTTTAY